MFNVEISHETQALLGEDKLETQGFLPLLQRIEGEEKQPVRIRLLKDLLASMNEAFGPAVWSEPAPKKMSTGRKVLLGLGLGAGAVLTLCDAFGNMSVLLSSLITVAGVGVPLLWASLGFGLLCLGLSILFQLLTFSKATETPLLSVRKDLACAMEERELINATALLTYQSSFYTKNTLNQQEITALSELIERRKADLASKAKAFDEARKKPLAKALKIGVTIGLSTWSFTAAFMIGYFALSMLPTLIPAIVIPIWGCMIFGVVMGVAGLLTYLLGGREEVNEALDRLIYADKDSIDALHEVKSLCTILPKTQMSPEPQEPISHPPLFPEPTPTSQAFNTPIPS